MQLLSTSLMLCRDGRLTGRRAAAMGGESMELQARLVNVSVVFDVFVRVCVCVDHDMYEYPHT
jgi:hypothetical protein